MLPDGLGMRLSMHGHKLAFIKFSFRTNSFTNTAVSINRLVSGASAVGPMYIMFMRNLSSEFLLIKNGSWDSSRPSVAQNDTLGVILGNNVSSQLCHSENPYDVVES